MDTSHFLEAIIAALSGGRAMYNFNGNVAQGDADFMDSLNRGTSIGVIGKAITEEMYNLKKAVLATNREMLGAQVSIVKANMELMSETVSTAMGALAGGLESNANRVIMSQAKKMMELAKANVKAEYTRKLAGAKMAVAQQGLATQVANTIGQLSEVGSAFTISALGGVIGTLLNSELGAGLTQAFAVYAGGQLAELIGSQLPGEHTDDLMGVGGSLLIAALFENIGAQISDIGSDISGFTTGALLSLNAMLYNIAAQERNYQLELARYNLEIMEKAQGVAEDYINAMQKMVEPWVDMGDKVMQAAEKFDTSIRQFTATTGYIGDQGDMYVRSQLAMAEHLALTFGKTNEEMMVVTKAYQDAAGGRQVNMSQAAYDTQFATGRLFGMADNEVAGLYGGMNIFNTSIESAGDHMTKMYKTITKMGLSTSKFGKDLTENLKKAQKYNFKGGVENMMKLTKWAQQTRFNLDAATSFSDKLLGGSLSDAIEASAKLQVLGGAAAIYSDPLGMLYDAGADVGSLAKRQAGMFSDLSGTFNAKTGETEFSWYENYMIKQRAAAAGMSEEDAKNMIRQQNKQGTINKVLQGYGLSEETMAAIGNRATYNQKTGKWEVTDITGETHNIEEYASGQRSLEDLLPENNDEAMLKIAEKSLGFEEQQTNYQKAIVMRFASSQYDLIKRESALNLEAMKNMYDSVEADEFMGHTITNSGELVRARLEGQAKMLTSDEMKKIFDNYFTAVERESIISDGRLLKIHEASERWAVSNEQLYEWATEQITGGQTNTIEAIQNGTDLFNSSMHDVGNGINQMVGGLPGIGGTLVQINDTLTNIAEHIGTSAGDGLDVLSQQPVYNIPSWQGIPYAYQQNNQHNIQSQHAPTAAQSPSGGGLWNKVKSGFHRVFGDGMGYTNGGFITNASDVKAIEDGRGIVGTSKYDQFLAAKNGGPIDKLFNGVIGGINTINEQINGGGKTGNGQITLNVVVSGKLDIRGNGSYDIINDLKSNDVFATNMASILSRQITGAIVDSSDKGRFNWGSV